MIVLNRGGYRNQPVYPKKAGMIMKHNVNKKHPTLAQGSTRGPWLKKSLHNT